MIHYDGQIWTALSDVPTGKDLFAVWGTSREDIYVVGADTAGTAGIILHFDGLSWTVDADNLASGLTSVGGVAGDIWAGGTNGVLYRKVGKLAWAQQASLPENPILFSPGQPVLSGMAASSRSSLLIAGSQLALYYYDGSTWSSIFSPNDGHFFFAPYAAPGDKQFLVGGNNYSLFRFTPPTQIDVVHEENVLGLALEAAWGSDSDHVVFVGENERVMTWNGTGVGVFPLPGGKIYDFYGVWASSPDDVWIVGNPRVIVRAQRLF